MFCGAMKPISGSNALISRAERLGPTRCSSKEWGWNGFCFWNGSLEKADPLRRKTMKIRCDFHSHTIYGDGRNTPEEMIQAACALGLTDFGISEHGFLEHYAYSETGTFGMDETAYLRYREEMEALKEKYRNRIRIYTGVERDGMGPKQEADYVIGSSHQLFKDGEYVMVDESEEILADAVNRLWKGDWYAMTADYYRQEKQIAELTECDFIGHFDLITKFNQDYRHFDESLDAYLEPALDAMRELNKAHIPFEINTGAMSRGFPKGALSVGPAFAGAKPDGRNHHDQFRQPPDRYHRLAV